jgi:hypothetical protein
MVSVDVSIVSMESSREVLWVRFFGAGAAR